MLDLEHFPALAKNKYFFLNHEKAGVAGLIRRLQRFSVARLRWLLNSMLIILIPFVGWQFLWMTIPMHNYCYEWQQPPHDSLQICPLNVTGVVSSRQMFWALNPLRSLPLGQPIQIAKNQHISTPKMPQYHKIGSESDWLLLFARFTGFHQVQVDCTLPDKSDNLTMTKLYPDIEGDQDPWFLLLSRSFHCKVCLPAWVEFMLTILHSHEKRSCRSGYERYNIYSKDFSNQLAASRADHVHSLVAPSWSSHCISSCLATRELDL